MICGNRGSFPIKIEVLNANTIHNIVIENSKQTISHEPKSTHPEKSRIQINHIRFVIVNIVINGFIVLKINVDHIIPTENQNIYV